MVNSSEKHKHTNERRDLGSGCRNLGNKKFVKLKSWLNKSCWQWKGAARKCFWFFDISFGSKVIAEKHKHTNERRDLVAGCRNLGDIAKFGQQKVCQTKKLT